MRHCAGFWLLLGVAGAAWGQGRTLTVQVPANRAWTRTGVYVNPGSTVLLEASGTVETVPSSDTRALFHRVPPEGRPARQSNKPEPLLPALVMLARIGNGPVMEAGARAEFPAGDPYGSGELELGINDDNVADNSGAWTVRITVRGDNGYQSQQQSNLGRYRAGDTGPRRRDSIDSVSAMDAKAQQLGPAFLGPVTSDVQMCSDGIGRFRQYQKATIYWSPETGAHEIHGSIRDTWRSAGAEQGNLGYPTSDELPGVDGVSKLNRFQRGTIVWSPRGGARIER